MNKHTPGPWAFAKYSKKRFGLGCAGHGAWIFLQTIYEDADSPELRANVRLMAAAPELLESLSEMVAMMDSGDEHGQGSEWHIKASAAIAKAIGVV